MTIVEHPVGRLVTFRVCPPVEDGNASRAATDLRRAVESIDGRVVVCADVSQARTFSQATTEIFIKMMKADNPKLERSALLVGTSGATFHLQVERMLREAGNPARRAFRETRELAAWLGSVLSEPERAALNAFLLGTAS